MVDMNDELREVARAVRPYLSELVGGDARALDDRLAGLLADPGDVDEHIDAVLRSNTRLLAFAQQMLTDDRLRPPPAQLAAERDIGTGGEGEPVDAERFSCPNGDYTWYRISVVFAVPDCPTHRVALVAG